MGANEKINLLNYAGHAPKLYETVAGNTTSDGYVLSWSVSNDSFVLAASGGGGGAPTGAQYVTLATDSSLTAERVLTAGTNVTITDGGAGGNVTIAAATQAPTDAQYVTLATDSTLSGERVLTAGDGITLTDAGAGGAITVAADGSSTLDLTGSDPYGFSSNGTAVGEVLKLGNTTTTAGAIYFLTDSSVWTLADASAASTSGPVLLGIALGTNSGSDGMLMKGYIRIPPASATSNQGDVIYLSTTAGGYNITAPSGTGQVVRIVGHLVIPVNSGADSLVFFHPSPNWITRT